MFCQKCGEKVKEGALFCQNCGAKLVHSPTEFVENTSAASAQVANNSSDRVISQTVEQSEARQVIPNEYAPSTQHLQQTVVAQAVIPMKKKSKVLPIILGVVGGVLALVILIGIVGGVSSPKDNRYISLVKEGYPLEGNSNVSYGEAFDYFFANPTWEFFVSTEDEDIVEFTGDCTYLDSPVTACIQFTVNEDDSTFQITYIDFNGVPQDFEVGGELLETVFSEAEEALS